ncbi:MAG: DUF4345 domain-containing protein [Pseudomonadota bacterium]
MNSRKALQVFTFLFGLGAALTAVGSMTGLDNPTYAALDLPPAIALDNNLRFYGGIWMALGLAAMWLAPHVSTQTALYRTLWGAIFLGGIGRVCSMIFAGTPPPEFIVYVVIELVLPPLAVWWQYHVANARP